MPADCVPSHAPLCGSIIKNVGHASARLAASMEAKDFGIPNLVAGSQFMDFSDSDGFAHGAPLVAFPLASQCQANGCAQISTRIGNGLQRKTAMNAEYLQAVKISTNPRKP